MTKPVTVTWKIDNQTYTESCLLIEETDPVFTTEGDEVEINPLQIPGFQGKVMFEDDHGLFGLSPEYIISIEDTEKS